MSASRLLVEAIRTAIIVGLRTLASGLEAALERFESAAVTSVPLRDEEIPEDRAVVPSASSTGVADWGFVSSAGPRSLVRPAA